MSCQSENHDPDSGQARKNNPETTKDSLATKSKQEPSLTTSQGIDLWFSKIEKPDGHHEEAKNDDQDGGGLCEDEKLTPLHELLKRIQDDDDGSHELEGKLDQWKDIINARSSEHQETALHVAVRRGFNKMARQLITAGAEVNVENSSGESPLHLACEDSNEQLVKILLGKGADPEHADASGIYPLHTAVVSGFGDTVISNLLGPTGFVINQTVGDAGWTPLNKAIWYGHEDVIDTLLEGGASLRIRDSDGWTPLMTAIKTRQHNTFHKLLRHLEKDPTERDVVNTPDNNGRTPLIQQISDRFGDTIDHIDHLLQMNPDFDIADEEGMTALHHAMISFSTWSYTETSPHETSPHKDVALKLVHLLSVETLLHLNKDGETAFDIAFDGDEESQIPAFEPLLNSLIDRLVEDGFIEEPLCWAVYRLERHTFALELFQKRYSDDIRQDLNHEQWAIVEWAIYARMPRVLLTYLRTLGLEKRASGDEKIDKSIENGRDMIKRLREEMQQSSRPLAGERGPTIGDASGKDAQVLRDMEDILNLLYPEKAEKPTKPLELSKPEKSMKSSLCKFRAAIVQSNFVKFRTIQEVLYDDDSMVPMGDIKRFKQFEYTPNVSSEQASQTSEELRENTKAKAQFTWIHFPSTNMVWMEDTTRKILKGEGCDKSEAEKVASFLRSSWIEIPDRTSTSRFMRPRHVVKKAYNATKQDEEDKNEWKDTSDIYSRHNEQRETPSAFEDREHGPAEEQRISFDDIASTPRREREEEPRSHSHVVDADRGEAERSKSFAVSATYMPYLYFSTYHQSESGEQMADTEDPSDFEKKIQHEVKMRQELFKAYENSVIHQPTTLDEFYYQFASDIISVMDRNSRNKDQVITKSLGRRDIKEQRFWPLLRVSQLWVWTIDEKWLITSTSCATDDIRDNLVADILEHLRKQVQDGSRRFGPTSATEMSRVIVDYCIGTHDRKLMRHRQGRSVHQIFSDSIHEVGRKDSNMFSLSYGPRKNTRQLESDLDVMERLRDALKAESEQLWYIKDIRDELNILKSIAACQRKVQSTMAGIGTNEELSSDWLLRSIKELENFAEQTQEAVKTTLALQERDLASFQADIANLQASESVKQGGTVLVFTLVTIWFVR
ncbi:hypothetical protein BHE90_001537 [Fusarium euwallaceae]|uniref:Uncharacterized protein n=2 Tax=Fusarium solani species complex TaxID=232080 RepID=A0A430M7G0_9HYPO|nr:hypothetical protein CEP51_007113 [Fusarium floridanum]RTE83916.1 hypothetical protein BHE90_001537 [Fusarium euwallaceae]